MSQFQWTDATHGIVRMAPHRPPLTLVPNAPEASEAGLLTLDVLFRNYSAYVAHIGIRILGQDDDVDDLVQDVFIEAGAGLHTVRERRAVKGWLGTIAVRVASRKLKVRRLKRFLGLDEARVEPEASLRFAGTDAEHSATIARIYRLLDQVPAKHRIAWLLRVVEGETVDEVARLCGCSRASAKRWIKSVEEHLERNLGHA
jgi:RNA polymerase sigma-70 factor (ECF subfamily)